MQNLNLVQLQVCQQDILKADIAVKNRIEEIKSVSINEGLFCLDQLDLDICIRLCFRNMS